MKVRYGLVVLAGVVIIAALAISPYVSLPWGGDDVAEAEAIPAVSGVCNVSVSNIPP